MVAQKGKDLLLKIDDAGSFVTVAGLRSKRIAFNSETVDITDADSAGRWRELLAGSGVQRASLSGSGIFKDAQSDAAIRAKFFAGEISGWQLQCRASARWKGRSRSPRWNIPAAMTAR
jgi:TP901-1 family phage major tail protein